MLSATSALLITVHIQRSREDQGKLSWMAVTAASMPFTHIIGLPPQLHHKFYQCYCCCCCCSSGGPESPAWILESKTAEAQTRLERPCLANPSCRCRLHMYPYIRIYVHNTHTHTRKETALHVKLDACCWHCYAHHYLVPSEVKIRCSSTGKANNPPAGQVEVRDALGGFGCHLSGEICSCNCWKLRHSCCSML